METEPMSAQAMRPPTTPKWWHKALLFAKRFFTIASVAGAVYLVIGSWMFGEWWYDWLWKTQFKDPDYTLAGLRDLLDGSFSLVMAALCVLFLAVLLGRIFAIRLFRIVDRFAGFIVFSSCLTVVVTFLLVYHAYHPTGPSIWTEMERTNDLVSNQLRIITSLPLVQTPIDFDYIDKDRVSALYNQIEPELGRRLHSRPDCWSGQGPEWGTLKVIVAEPGRMLDHHWRAVNEHCQKIASLTSHFRGRSALRRSAAPSGRRPRPMSAPSRSRRA